MDRIKKILIIFISIFVLCSFSQVQKIPYKFLRQNCEPDWLLIEKIEEGYKDDSSLEDYEWWLEATSKTQDYLESLNKLSINQSLMGEWYLFDTNGNKIEKYGYDISYHIIFYEYNHFMQYRDLSNAGWLYKGRNEEFYYESRWIGYLRQIKIFDDKMYIYILDGDYWVLDPIHEGGKYAFEKTSDIPDESGFS